MCKFLSELTMSEVTDFFTMLIAIGSAWLLYKTFESQKKSTEIAKEVSEIDRRAKRAEYLPEIESEIRAMYPSKSDGSGGYFPDFYNGEETTITIKIIFKKHPIQLLNWNPYHIENKIKIECSPFPFDIDRILLPGKYFEMRITLNLQEYFNLPLINSKPSLESLEDDNYNEKDYTEELFFHTKLYFADMIGNKYELSFDINGLYKISLADLKMID